MFTKTDTYSSIKTVIDASTFGAREQIYGVVGHIDNVEQQIDTPLGTLLICSIPGEDKRQPHRNYKRGEHIVSEDFVFVGRDDQKIVIIVGDGVTNKGKGGREAAQVCYAVTQSLWQSSADLDLPNLFKRWHEAIAKSADPEGSVAITIISIEPCSIPKEPNIIAKAQFLSSGDVKGALHTSASRFTAAPYYSTRLHRKKENNKLYRAATGIKYYRPDESPTLYCYAGDILHNATDGVEDFDEAVKSVMLNKNIAFLDLPLHLQGELYLAMLEKKSEHMLLASKIKRQEKLNVNLYEKYVQIDTVDNKPSMTIKALDDMTSVIFQIKS